MMMMMISSSVCVCLLTNERYRTTAAPWSSCGRISWSAKGCASTGGGTPTRSSRSTASTRRRTGGRRPTCSSSTPATGGRTARRPEGTAMFSVLQAHTYSTPERCALCTDRTTTRKAARCTLDSTRLKLTGEPSRHGLAGSTRTWTRREASSSTGDTPLRISGDDGRGRAINST